MPKFLLIDNSITGLGGHHYQYALHCLRAADSVGYDAYLATNRENTDGGEAWEVVPAYRNGFWANDSHSQKMENIHSWFSKTRLKTPASLALRALGPLIIKRLMDADRAREFAEDTKDLLSKVPLKEGDVAFLPTSGLTELFGASEAGGGGAWNFLFRRNIHVGSPHSYSHTYVKLRLLRAAFGRFRRRPGVRARFWTDSDQLTEEYRMVEPGFATLPIPHTSPKPASPPASSTVSYLGDARSEKGYHHLPRAVGDLWEGHVEPGRLRFLIQSNYNIPGGEPAAAVARNQLEQMASPGKLDLVYEPLGAREYEDALAQSLALLLPYDPQNYYARSSGICAEALAQGIPVIAPAGSWPARQFATETYEYQNGLRAKAVKEYRMSADLEFESDCGEKTPPARLDRRCPSMRATVQAKGSDWVLARLDFGPDNEAPGARILLRQLDGAGRTLAESEHAVESTDLGYATCLARLDPDAEAVEAAAEASFSEAVLEVSDIVVSLLQGSFPLGSVGIAYDDPSRISECVADLADNAGHYKSTARLFSDSYYARHNARSLVEKLA